MSERWRNVLGGTLALAACILTLGAHELLYRPSAPASRQYFLTGRVLGNYTWGVAAVLFLIGLGVGYLLRAAPLAAAAGFVIVMASATCYEIQRFPTSHNLLPFDAIGWLVMAAPLAIGAALGNRVRGKPPGAAHAPVSGGGGFD